VFEQIIHYLTGTMDYKIYYSRYPAILEEYSDANWISDIDELYAMSGYVFTLCDASVSWRSCK
jgi:chaperone required for assembly of F1-ATPase